jgi:hypothetical protein
VPSVQKSRSFRPFRVFTFAAAISRIKKHRVHTLPKKNKGETSSCCG